MIDELYTPVSEIARLRHGGTWYTHVEVDWVRLDRAVPIAAYPALIGDYAVLSDAERADAERYMDELFTGKEYHILRRYLAGRGIATECGVVPIPMVVKPAHVGFTATPAHKMIAIDQSGAFGWYELDDSAGTLPFRVAGMFYIGGGAPAAG
jgi:hypothetical protein